jgi:hypothetical protein
VFTPFDRPAHIVGSPTPVVGAAHQMLPIGQMSLIGKMLPIRQMLLIGRMLLILPAPAVGAAPHDTIAKTKPAKTINSAMLLIRRRNNWKCTMALGFKPNTWRQNATQLTPECVKAK